MLALTILVLACILAWPASLATSAPSIPPGPALLTPVSTPISTVSGYEYARLDNPLRTVVTDRAGGWLATFTDGASTVSLAGPVRTFSESTAAHPVISNVWVRVLPQPFDGVANEGWLTQVLGDESPDVLAISLQYLEDAPPLIEGELRVAGKSTYGPESADGARREGADFNDYLGIPWAYGDRVRRPRPEFFGAMDCSGFVRMVWGYRGELPLTYAPNGSAIPRHSWQILASAPGIVVTPNAGVQVGEFSSLAPGDLVFFSGESNNPSSRISHVGMYLSQDTGGHHRFISSRRTANGPTLGDQGGRSLLDGNGFYARRFRAARRF